MQIHCNGNKKELSYATFACSTSPFTYMYHSADVVHESVLENLIELGPSI